MPTIDLNARSFSIRSSLQMPSDQFEADVEGQGHFVDAATTDRINLVAGYKDLDGVEHEVVVLTDAIIDRYRVGRRSGEVTAGVTGFDQISLLLNQRFDMRFLRFPEKTEVSSSVNPADATPKMVGVFSAQSIARSACTAVGLELVWDCRDYEYVEDFIASGPAINTVRAMIRPFTLIEPFKADIYLKGKTVIVKQRTPDMIADDTNVFTVADARLDSVDVERTRPIKYGRVTLRGRKEVDPASGFGKTPDANGGGFFQAGSVTIETVTETRSGSAVASRIVERTTYRIPDQIATAVEKETFARSGTGGLKRVSKETTTNTWEASLYDITGAVTRQPLQERTDTVVEGIAAGDKTGQVREIRSQETEYSYDSDRFLRSTRKLTKSLELKSGKLLDTDLVVTTLRDEGPLFIKSTTEEFKWDKKKNQWNPTKSSEQVSGGHRPGGPGRGVGGGVAGLNSTLASAIGQEVEVSFIISTDPDAVDVEESFSNLSLGDLNYLMSLFVAASGLWEYEVAFTGVSIPWVGRGNVVRLTDFKGIDDAEIPLSDMLVHELTLKYDESGDEPSSTSEVRAVFWRA